MDCTVHGITKSQTRRSDFHLGFPERSVDKESACIAGDPGSIPGLGRSAAKCAGILSTALSQHHLSGLEIAPLEFHNLH